MVLRCCANDMSWGLRRRSSSEASSGVSMPMANTARVQARGWSINNQPARNMDRNAAGSRLRRRLSAIFQRDRAERLLRS
ncbi:hypothetical protein D3C76_1256430 [compost metagenome]